MPRIDHVAVESQDPAATAAFYERFFGARIVRTEGHPVMAYLGTTAFALHEPGGPGPHTGVRVSEQELEELLQRKVDVLTDASIHPAIRQRITAEARGV